MTGIEYSGFVHLKKDQLLHSVFAFSEEDYGDNPYFGKEDQKAMELCVELNPR
jgi:hypothetical protein